MELVAGFRSALNRKSLFRRGFVDGIGGGPSYPIPVIVRCCMTGEKRGEKVVQARGGDP